MRIELSGTSIRPAPLVLRYTANSNFYPANYISQGFTHFEVICIGAGGGMGGGVDQGSGARSYGGAGGGGGFHRVRGLLSALPATCQVTVGAGGILGNDSADPASTTDGGDGGYSSFGGGTCQASGGKGGKRAISNSTTVSTQANGGDGGIGNRTIAGGGGIGGGPGSSGVNGTAGADGTLFNNVGKGGGGGAGGVGTYGVGTNIRATAGGRGSYNPNDTSVYGPGDPPDSEIIAGGASGAKAAPLNGLPTVYGQSKGQRLPGDPGIVILRLTSE